MTINATGLQWGPGNQYAYDPVSKRYFAGENAEGNAWSSGPLSVGTTQYTATPLNNAGYQKWLQQNPNNPLGYPGIFQNLSGADFSGVDSLSPDLQKYFGPGSLIRSWDGSYGPPQAQTITSAPEESFLSSFMQGPGMVLGSALGANALFGGGLSSLFGGGASLFPGEAVIGNAFNPYGGSFLSSLANGLSNIPTGLSNLLNGGASGAAGAGAAGGSMNLSDFYNAIDAADAGAGIGGTAVSPSMSIPGVGDVYGNPLQYFNNLLPGAGTAANAVRSIFGGNNSGGSLLGAGLGALLGSLGANSKPAGTTTSIQDIPDYLKPYQSMNLTSGLSNMSQASAGQALLPGAQQYMQKTINGDFLDPNQNPAFQPYVKDLMGQAGANYAGLYGKNPDNLNNSGFQEGYTRAITNAVLPLYNSAFQTAQGNQYNAASNAPAYANNVAGAALAPNLAFKNLYTGPTANTQPYFTSPLGGALSGGLAGYTFGNSIFGSKN